MVSMRLRVQQSNLSETELEKLSETLGRSNYLVRTIPMVIWRNDFTNAAQLLKQFPGKLDDLNSFGGSLLGRAVQMGNAAQVEFLLAQGAKPDPDHMQFGASPLCTAIQSRHWSIAKQLLAAGASATRTNIWGQSPLEMVVGTIWNGTPTNDQSIEVVRLLLKSGADPFKEARGGESDSIVEYALRRQNPQFFADLMLTNSLDPGRHTSNGDTALHVAAMWGCTNAMEFLLHAGVSLEQTNANGLTPLQRIADGMSGRTGLPSPRGVRFVRGPNGFGPSQPGDVAAFLLKHGARLDVCSAAGLGQTNELSAMLRTNRGLVNARDGLGRTPLFYAVSSMQVYATRILLLSGADASLAAPRPFPDGRYAPGRPAGTTPLHIAARQIPEITEMLLRAGARVAATDDEGNTPLHLSASAWQTNCLVLLLGGHAPLDATNHAGKTALRVAVETGSSQNVALLLKAGANPATGLAGETLAHIAAERGGGGEVLKVLVQQGLAVDARDNAGRTPFERAAKARQWDALKFLLAKHADINAADAQGNTALHLVSEEQDDTVNHPAELSFWDGWKQGALGRGGWTGKGLSKLIQWKMVSPPPGFSWTNTSLTEWLVQHGAKPGATNHSGQTPLHVLCGQQWFSYPSGDPTNRLAILFKAGAKVQARDASGVTCLHVAATNAPPEVLSLLQGHLASESSVGKFVCTDNDGRTPLHYIVRDGNMNRDEVMRREAALLAGGFDPNVVDQKGRTPLHEAMLRSDNTYNWQGSPTVTMLLSNKANPNLQDKDGATPLHLAMKAWQANPANAYWVFDTACLLLTNHAEPNLRDKEGRTPLHIFASAKPRWSYPGGKLEELLLDRGWDFSIRDNSGEVPIHLLIANMDTSYTDAMKVLREIVTKDPALLSLTNAGGDTPLHLAIRADRSHGTEVLMKAGADPTLKNAKGETSLRLVTELTPGNPLDQIVKPPGTSMGFFHTINSRDQAGFERWLEADPTLCCVTNAQGETPLLAATKAKLDTFATQLLERGATLDTLSAMRLGRMAEFRQLLKSAPRPIPRYWLFEAVRFKRLAALRALAEAGGDIGAADDEGHSLLYRATLINQNQTVDWLASQGLHETLFDSIARGDTNAVDAFLKANPGLVNATNRQGRTPLFTAIAATNQPLARHFLDLHAKTGHTPEGWTPLHLAAAKNLTDIGAALLSGGADPNEFASGGMAPLHIAAAYGNADFCTLLLEHGALVNLRPSAASASFGNAPLLWAANRGGSAVVKVLLEHGADPKVTNRSSATAATLVSRPQSWLMGFSAPWEAYIRRQQKLDATERAEILKLLSPETEVRK